MEKFSLFRKHVIRLVIISSLIILMTTNIYAEGPSLRINQADLIYFIMTDRFKDGDPANNQKVLPKDMSAYHGGDFRGIIDKLDYIKSLGFTAIWISPVVANQIRGYHGYWATDFYETNERFGTLDELKELVEKAHSKEIKVIVDLVVNHTGGMHSWLDDPQYQSWFHQRGTITNWNDQQEVEEGRLANLPDLDQGNPEVKKYLIEMAKWWIRETNIDGYRLDTVRHVPKEFWVDFSSEIKKEFPDFYLIGEVFDGRSGYVASYQRTGIDGLVDFPLYFALNDVFKDGQSVERLTNMIEECHNLYEAPHLMGTFIDNHDVPRFVNQLYFFPEERLKQALAFMMTYTGIPILYYGTEIGMDGGADPDNRRDMDWSAKSQLIDYVKQLTAIRKNNKALIYGDFQVVPIENHTLCYLRQYEDNTVLTVFNLSEDKEQVEFMLPEEFQNKKGVWQDLIDLKEVTFKKGKVRLKMAPRQVCIFESLN